MRRYLDARRRQQPRRPGRGISTTIPSSTCSNRFSRWSSRSTSLAWSESDYMPPPAVGWDLEFESGSLHRRVCELSVPAETKRLLLRFGAGLGNSVGPTGEVGTLLYSTSPNQPINRPCQKS